MSESHHWSALLRHMVTRVLDWIFRPRSVGARILSAGLTLIGFSLAGSLLFEINIPTDQGSLKLAFDGSGGVPAVLAYVGFFLGALLAVSGTVMLVIEHHRESRRRVIAIEQRGLRDFSGTPLEKAVPRSIQGRRETLPIDTRQNIRDGEVVMPAVALENLSLVARDLGLRTKGLNPADVEVIYGGLAPVPFTFLTGFLVDDEHKVTIMDWDRNAQSWRALDAEDDGEVFLPTDFSVIADHTEVVLAVSVSYKADSSAIQKTFGHLPVVELALTKGGTDCHWSEQKQQRLARHFRETAIQLGNLRIQRIHLVIAAQNSLTFRFGQSYDRRNLPEAIIYQYEKWQPVPYPWGIKLPTHGRQQAGFVDRSGSREFFHAGQL